MWRRYTPPPFIFYTSSKVIFMVKIILKIIGIGFWIGGAVHGLIIFGIMEEIAPLTVTLYFHSLAVLSPLCGTGIILLKKWGRQLGFWIVCTQIPAHFYMIWLDTLTDWQSGVSVIERGVDLAFAVFYLVFFNTRKVRNVFKSN